MAKFTTMSALKNQAVEGDNVPESAGAPGWLKRIREGDWLASGCAGLTKRSDTFKGHIAHVRAKAWTGDVHS